MGFAYLSGQANVCIDLYPMVSHLGVYHLTRRLRHDHIGFLNRHMTVNAFVHDLVTHLSGHAAALPVMTGQAFKRIGLEWLSGGVDIVASRTVHPL
jgi:hypothetical protein